MGFDAPAKPQSMRVHWFEHVRKTRKKLSRETKVSVTHREAMQKASTTWPDVKEKLVKKRDRIQKKEAKALKQASKSKKTIKVIVKR